MRFRADFRRATVDLTGPVTDGRAVRYRLVGAAEGLVNGFDNAEQWLRVLPMLSFDLGRRRTLQLDGEYYDQRGRGYRHAVPVTPDTQKGDFSAERRELLAFYRFSLHALAGERDEAGAALREVLAHDPRNPYYLWVASGPQ